MKTFIFWLIVLVSFAVISATTVLLASGNKINFKAKKIQKTGLIVLDSEPSDANISLCGEVQDNKTPFRKRYIEPGNYLIQVTKDNYILWEKSVQIGEGQAYTNKDIILFLINPTVEEIKNQKDIDEFNAILETDRTKNQGIEIKDSEIWVDDQIVARFSTPILNAIWYNDNHILFQKNDEIRVIEKDGSNDTMLVKLSDLRPTNFTTINSYKTLIFKDGELLKSAKIR